MIDLNSVLARFSVEISLDNLDQPLTDLKIRAKVPTELVPRIIEALSGNE